ncbi:MAG: hypothetical protein HY518_01880 [Candidatus Aenigmarchaeota archaeon]|nr:hypothetical protein [Candidatus Aenigmarchaeota archaeon]
MSMLEHPHYHIGKMGQRLGKGGYDAVSMEEVLGIEFRDNDGEQLRLFLAGEVEFARRYVEERLVLMEGLVEKVGRRGMRAQEPWRTASFEFGEFYRLTSQGWELYHELFSRRGRRR